MLGGLVAGVVLLTYRFDPTSLNNAGLTISIAGIGAVTGLYYLSVHQLIKKRYERVSAAALSGISSLNIVLITVASGGLDSPYYALWLLEIVVAGVFGFEATAIASGVALVYYAAEVLMHAGTSGYFVAHLPQLISTLVTAGVAEWIHTLLGRSSVQHKEVAQLSGQLNQEALKSNVIMQSVGDGILVVNSERQIQLFNPAAVGMTGWDEDSAQSIDYRLVLNLHDAKGNQLANDADPFCAMWESGKSLIRNDLIMFTKGGHQVAVSLSLSPIFGADKKISGGIALFRDITADKEVERQRNEFISTASHEMRTPVAAIEGYLSLAMNPAVATIDVRAKGFLDKAHTSTEHLGGLFRDLLSITKMEDGAKPDALEIFDLTQLIKESVADMEFSAKSKGLELQFGTADTSIRGQHSVLPVYAVKANSPRVREVVMNLIENALKFTTEGGVHVTIGGTNDTVTVSVSDTGIGIASEDIPHLFQKFYRIDSTATRTIGGTGLGLYLCRTIIELFNGRIWIESKLNQGSSFKFSLPRLASDKISVPIPAVTPAAAPLAAPPATPLTSVGGAKTALPTPSLTDVKVPVAAG